MKDTAIEFRQVSKQFKGAGKTGGFRCVAYDQGGRVYHDPRLFRLRKDDASENGQPSV